MDRQFSRISVCILVMAMALLAALATPRPLSDAQLDGVFAAGFDIKLDLGLSVDASDPQSVVIQTSDPAKLQQAFNQNLPLTRSVSGARNTGIIDPTGAYMPNLQNLTVNNINIAGDALKNATTLMNIFAMNGDVAVGVNLNVIVNPTNSSFTVTQTNMNWANLLSSATATTSGAN